MKLYLRPFFLAEQTGLHERYEIKVGFMSNPFRLNSFTFCLHVVTFLSGAAVFTRKNPFPPDPPLPRSHYSPSRSRKIPKQQKRLVRVTLVSFLCTSCTFKFCDFRGLHCIQFQCFCFIIILHISFTVLTSWISNKLIFKVQKRQYTKYCCLKRSPLHTDFCFKYYFLNGIHVLCTI